MKNRELRGAIDNPLIHAWANSNSERWLSAGALARCRLVAALPAASLGDVMIARGAIGDFAARRTRYRIKAVSTSQLHLNHLLSRLHHHYGCIRH